MVRSWQWPRGCLWRGSCRVARRGSCWVARQGSCRGALASPARILPGVLWVSSVRISVRVVASQPPSDLEHSMSSQRSACHHRGASQPWYNVVVDIGGCGFKGGSLCRCGRAALARALPRLPRLPRLPGKGIARETCFVHLHFVALVLDVALFVSSLWLLSGFPPLPCYAWPWRVALTARAQVKG